MKRREFITLLGGATAGVPLMAHAQQQAAKTLRVGTANAQPRTAPQWVAFVQRMAELGYREGDNFAYDHVQIQNTDAWESGYREIATRKPDVIVAAGPEASLKAALGVTDGIPVVMIAVDYDPVAKGYVQSLSRPSERVTGIYFQNVELVAKRLEILKQAFPDVTTMTVFWDRFSADHWAVMQTVAGQFGVTLNGIEMRERPYDYERAMVSAVSSGSFLYAGGSPFFFLDRARLAEFAIQHRLATICELREHVIAGGLVSYGPSLTAMFALSAKYVDRIAKGAKTNDLPVEQPTTFELAVNLKTAKAIGIEVPPALITRADEVIE